MKRLWLALQLFVWGLAATGCPAAGAQTRSSSTARFSWPVQGVIYAKFGKRGETRFDGLDLSAPEGTPILAAGEGTVLFAGPLKGYGRAVIVEHSDGFVTLYAQLKDLRVKEKERVKKGDELARMGPGSATSGSHLHFEVRLNRLPVDPMKYLPSPE